MSVTVPFRRPPPLNRSVILTLRFKLLTHGGRIVRVAETVFADVAAIVAGVFVPTARVVTVNVALVAPAAMLMFAGTEA